MNQYCAVSDIFHQSPIPCVVLKSLCPGTDHTVVNNVCRTRWIARLDAFDNFCDLSPAILTAIEAIAKNVDCKYSRSNVDYCNSCDCQKNLIIYNRSYQEAARYRQRSSQSDK